MAAQKDLVRFVHDALSAGRSRTEIEAALTEEGWAPRDIEAGLAAYADSAFVPPVPRPVRTTTPRHAFLYALLFIALAVTAVNLVNLVHAQIDRALPDPAFETWAERVAGRIRWAVAGLVVATPVYLLVARAIDRAAAADESILKSPVRKWLTYFALLISALIFLGDAIFVLYRFLAGELTLRFALKAGTVALLSGAIFLHYLREAESGRARGTPHLAVVAGLVGLAVASAFWSVGGPGTARSEAFDLARYRDLAEIARALECDRTPEAPRNLPEELSVASLYAHCMGVVA
jgi:hypothetical protein